MRGQIAFNSTSNIIRGEGRGAVAMLFIRTVVDFKKTLKQQGVLGTFGRDNSCLFQIRT